MNPFEEKIHNIIEKLRLQKDAWSKEERAVMRLLKTSYENGTGKITQLTIALSEDWMGCHPKYEKRNPGDETTLRKVRQVVRDLRVKRGAPIISDEDGYWIPKTQGEVDEYMRRTEQVAKAQAASYFETYKSMDAILGVKSEYFEAQSSFMEDLVEAPEKQAVIVNPE